MSRIHFIYNPIAGKGLSQKVFAQTEQRMRALGAEYSVAISEYEGHAPELVKAALQEGHGCIVAVGGDGTVREVAEVMAGSDTPMGILPCGTGNDFANGLRIPNDPEKALEILLAGNTRKMDTGEANGDFFINVAGFGFDVDVLIYTEKYKRFRGLTAYILGLLHALFGMKMRRVHIRTPEREFDCDAMEVAVGNGTQFGGGMKVTPEADPCDGLLDVCIIRDVNKLTVLKVLVRFVKGGHVNLPICEYFKTTEISVTSEPDSPLQLDGAIMGSTPVTFKINPAAIQVVCG